MTTDQLNELEVLARAAQLPTTLSADQNGMVRRDDERVVIAEVFMSKLFEDERQWARLYTQFIAAANPATILNLIALARQALATQTVRLNYAPPEDRE